MRATTPSRISRRCWRIRGCVSHGWPAACPSAATSDTPTRARLAVRWRGVARCERGAVCAVIRACQSPAVCPERRAGMDGDEILQRARRQRHTTLSLADQVKEDRWRAPVMPGGATIHDVLAHLLAWDEWAVGVFELSHLRDEVPQALARALDDVDGFNARAQARLRNITRDDMLSSLQTVSDRIVKSSLAVGGADWAKRRLPGLTFAVGGSDMRPPRQVTPSVGGGRRMMTENG